MQPAHSLSSVKYSGGLQAPLPLGLSRLDEVMAVCKHWCYIWEEEPCRSKFKGKLLLSATSDLECRCPQGKLWLKNCIQSVCLTKSRTCRVGRKSDSCEPISWRVHSNCFRNSAASQILRGRTICKPQMLAFSSCRNDWTPSKYPCMHTATLPSRPAPKQSPRKIMATKPFLAIVLPVLLAFLGI